MSTIKLAWEVIDYWIKKDYDGDKDKAADDLCDPQMRNAPSNLDACALRIMECIEDNELAQFSDDIIHLSSQIELAGY